MSTVITPESEIDTFVAEVRSALADLPEHEVEELTGGLAADLTDASAEYWDWRGRVGSPQDYAAELRTAAGLPAGQGGAGWWARTVRSGQRVVTELKAQPWMAPIVAHQDDLRFTWWLTRGFVLALLVSFGFLGRLSWMLFLAPLAMIGSVALGRSTRRPKARRIANLAVTVLAALLLFPVGVSVVDRYRAGEQELNLMNAGYDYTDSGEYPSVGGGEVTNIYPYDAKGRRLSGVRLFTQDGVEVNLRSDRSLSIDDTGSNGEVSEFPALRERKDRWAAVIDPVTGDKLWDPPVAISALPTPPTKPAPSPTPSGSSTPDSGESSAP